MSKTTVLLFGTLALAFAACSPRPEAPPLKSPQTGPQASRAEEAPAGGSAVERAAARAPDGVSIAYDVRGAGDPTLVFVHCWACDRTFWKEQVDVFAEDHRVVTLDLAGHGESGREREAWSVLGLAGDVEAVVDELGLERVVLVGHSMGGPVSLEAARRMPGRVLGVACIDTLHDLSARFPKELAEQLVALYRADYAGTMAASVGYMFPFARPELESWVAERASLADPEGTIALLADFTDLDLPSVARQLRVPVRCVNVEPVEGYGQPTNIEGNQELLDFDARLIGGVGHYVQLERPAELNDALRWAIGEIETAQVGRE
jgi:pimeloyl-ACP methyl ester carboxylesterase